MKSIIVGTAGHIDHGKTALVKALTGIDADRLQEEKRRGITIDLGFAHMELASPDGERLQVGFVDVPGHEKFVRNMLAGVGGIDLVLLVIAADESIKPQTREHFDILQLLGVRHGITVLTKSDAVDADTLEVVRLEVEEFLRGTFLEVPKSPIVPVSSLTGAGLEDLKRALMVAAADVEARDSEALARLPIDRVFTMKGFGTVVTGTLISGTIHSEGELEVFPTGRRVRVRGIQVHGRRAEQAVAGQRTAVNLAGASLEDLCRGMILATPGMFAPTRTVDVHLRLLPSAGRALKDRSKVHFHAHSMECVAEVSYQHSMELNANLAQKDGGWQLTPASQGFARIRLREAALLLPGDRFIIRQFSPVVTIGGGIVLDATPLSRSRQVLGDGLLKVSINGNPKDILMARIVRRAGEALTITQTVSETGWRREMIAVHLKDLIAKETILKFGDLLLSSGVVASLRQFVPEALSLFHKENPLVPGVAKETLREQLNLSPEVFSAVLELLTGERRLEVAGDIVRLPGHGVVMKDEEAESKKKIEDAFANAGLKVPALHEVLAGLKVDKARAQKIVTLLLRERVLVKVSEDMVFHRSALEGLKKQLAVQKAKSSKMDVALFKEITGVSRKYAIPLLEYLDRERVTRRLADTREIL
ncbi:MAG TPA: selenocysteine-specific translation elongation factor [Candidatus Sulfotelmatobacter sp.]|nr:selenocysteine-specific translation elongation factor [Candidatus Sulfotelmatobacter sp.]